MKRLELSNKTYLMRHWLVWYIVTRGGKDWERLGRLKNRKRTRPFDIDKAAKGLAKRQSTPTGPNPFFDEAAADREVAKNTPKH